MRLIRFAAVASIVLAAPAASAAQAASMITLADLTAVGTAEAFEVLTLPGKSKVDYFCAAADFAMRRLDASNNDRLVVTYTRAPSQYRASRLAIGFRLAAPDVRKGGPILFGPRKGQVMSVGHARGLCNAVRAQRTRDEDDDND